ncbi:uncharacterized protein BDZ99DRAFT_472272 [Mytilinidion resinicola]|uniref:Uncharacterized protein n=1 Tax=Mytilinidion resinicola TaxID=574789 RepID=A0A6A6Z3P8_9PEZI|nr:uncharacterized protein BDZ99DRAFT_472272 [Mytilinidion resinicola]KAF2814904.1 hypothetical protein BDZ99DRAFT_472272 [Mytilinidion resinicola]
MAASWHSQRPGSYFQSGEDAPALAVEGVQPALCQPTRSHLFCARFASVRLQRIRREIPAVSFGRRSSMHTKDARGDTWPVPRRNQATTLTREPSTVTTAHQHTLLFSELLSLLISLYGTMMYFLVFATLIFSTPAYLVCDLANCQLTAVTISSTDDCIASLNHSIFLRSNGVQLTRANPRHETPHPRITRLNTSPSSGWRSPNLR